jgi:hypothetical protein
MPPSGGIFLCEFAPAHLSRNSRPERSSDAEGIDGPDDTDLGAALGDQMFELPEPVQGDVPHRTTSPILFNPWELRTVSKAAALRPEQWTTSPGAFGTDIGPGKPERG